VEIEHTLSMHQAMCAERHGPLAKRHLHRRTAPGIQITADDGVTDDVVDDHAHRPAHLEGMTATLRRGGLPDHLGKDELAEAEMLRVTVGEQGVADGNGEHTVATRGVPIGDTFEEIDARFRHFGAYRYKK